MPFHIIRDDITRQAVDAIVNAANPSLLGGGGVDGAIHYAAGPELLKYCLSLGGCEVGEAKLTPGFKLPAKYVIHTVGPVWRGGGRGEERFLRSCYRNALDLALTHEMTSIAFPLISAGAYGYPKDQALDIAVQEIGAFLLEHEMDVTLVVYDEGSYQLSASRFSGLRSFIEARIPEAAEQNRSVRLQREWALQSMAQQKAGTAPTPMGQSRPQPGHAAPSAPAAEAAEAFEEPTSDEPASAEQARRRLFPGLRRRKERRKAEADASAPQIPREDREEAHSAAAARPQPEPQPAAYCSQPAAHFPPFRESDSTARPYGSAESANNGLANAFQERPGQTELWSCACGAKNRGNYCGMCGRARSFPDAVPPMPGNLRDRLRTLDESFSQMLLRKIDESGMSDSVCYKRANVDRKLFSKIRSDPNYRPSKPTVLAFAIALELDLAETRELLMKAGFALSHSNKFDVIIEYFILNRNYNIFEINEALFAFDQNLLGA